MNEVGTKVGSMSQSYALQRYENMYSSRADLPDTNPMKQLLGKAIVDMANAMQKATKQLEQVNPIRARKVELRDERDEMADWKRSV